MSRNISGKVKSFIFERDNGKCIYCGSFENLEFDHIIPASKGGSNTERNIQLVCKKHNLQKFNSLNDDYLRDPMVKKGKRLINKKQTKYLFYKKTKRSIITIPRGTLYHNGFDWSHKDGIKIAVKAIDGEKSIFLWKREKED